MLSFNTLRYHITHAQIDIRSISAVISATFVKPKLDIEKQETQISIQDVKPKCVIDASVCKSEEGHEPITQITGDAARQAIQDAHDATAEINEEWDELSNVTINRNVYRQVAYQKAMGKQQDVGLTFIPSEPPKISFTQSVLKMDIKPKQLEFIWDVTTSADVRVLRENKVNIYMKSYPSIKIDYVGDQKKDTSSGFDISA